MSDSGDAQDTTPAEATAVVSGRSGFGLDEFTIWIGLGALALIIAALLLVLVRPTTSPPMDESGPGGVVHNYYLALANNDPKTAYGYLTREAQSKTTYEQFVGRYGPRSDNPLVRLGEERIEGDTARVTVTLSYRSGGFWLWSEGYSRQQVTVLRLEDGAWRLTP